MRDLELDRHWQQLLLGAAHTKSAPGHVVSRIAPEGRWNFWLALIQPDGTKTLLMGLSDSLPPLIDELPASRGFSIRSSVTIPPGLAANAILEVRLENPAFSDIFDVLAEDLVRAAERETEESRALAAALNQLRKWQRFVEKIPPEGLTEEQRRGLYGELYFLRNHLAPLLGLRHAIMAWTGPSGSYQDFQGQGFGIEVKTSASKEPQTMRITSERQLDGQGLCMLFLGHLSLEEKIGSGETLPQVVDDLRQRAAKAACEVEFDSRLYEWGYHDLHSGVYSRYGYVLRGEHMYEVRDSFPRIAEADLRPGVGNVTYSIAVSGCRPYFLTFTEFTDRLGNRPA